jgi:hypothetical protein
VDFVEEYIRHNPDLMIQFGRYGVLKKDYRGGFAIRHMRDFLITSGQAYKRELSPFRTSDIPAEVLPQVPDLEQLTHLFSLRTDIEIRLRRAIILYMQVTHSFDPSKIADAVATSLKARVARKFPASLFVGRPPEAVMNELYALDLKDIILSNWAMFAPLFQMDQVRFVQNMDTLNRARRADAHAKPLSSAEFEDFKNSYGWLLRCLERIPSTGQG